MKPKLLNSEDVNSLLRERGFRFPLPNFNEPSGYVLEEKGRIPNDGSKRVVLCKDIIRKCENSSSVLFWVEDYGIWPSSEHMELFMGYRSSFVGMESIEDFPAVL